MRSNRVALCAVGILLAAILGCSRPQRGGPRIPTTGVVGQVLVDGAPLARVQVTSHPLPGGAIHYSLSTQTDEEGRFRFGTYEAGDGLPAGTYKLTFEQVTLDGLKGPKDLFRGRYRNPARAPVEVTVTDGEPVDVGLVELTTE